ncbi:type IV secretory system conjugative DNA transfer family protein [Halobacillus sp. Marseille-Q1614]|uniref:type IV secretory system conjugative DNA transfer family protein n=1 Tax=Halobacillus sp. Marseille-Q1614 TaxID=2709134 RepID=UPI0015708DDF|nr:TraM recognition domain-containing protein [Halobacillus sp. Marseille-Q1614]
MGVIAGILLGVALLVVLFPVVLVALLLFGLTLSTKKVRWLTYGSLLGGLTFALTVYVAGWTELFQYIPFMFSLFGMESLIAPVQAAVNQGEAFQMSVASYVLILSSATVVARIFLSVYQFFKGKVVKPKEDAILEYRASKDYYSIFNQRYHLNRKVQAKYRKAKKAEIQKEGRTTDVLLGIDEYGKAAHMDLKEMNQHVLLQGTTGSGKTIVSYSLVEPTLMNGETVFFIDGKGDPKTIQELQSLCDYYGRKLHVFSEHTQLKYNPIRNGNRTSVTDRIMAIFDWSNEFYKNEAENQLQKVIHFLDDYGFKRDLENVTKYLSIPRIYEVLTKDYETVEETIQEKVPVKQTVPDQAKIDDILGVMSSGPSSEESMEYKVQEKVIERTKQTERSKKYMMYFFDKEILSEEEEEAILNGEDQTSQLFRGMQSQLEKLLYSELGHLLDDTEDGLDLMDIVQKGESVVFSFNSLSYAEFMKRFARFVIADISNVVQQQFGKQQNQGITGVFDEFGAYGSSTIVDIVARSRSANFRAVIGIQSFADLTLQGHDISQQVIDNVNTFFLGRSNSDSSPEKASNVIGTFKDIDITHQLENKGTMFKRLDFKSEKGTTRNVNRFYVHPDQIKEFTTGEFAVFQKSVKERAKRRIVYFRNPLEGLDPLAPKTKVSLLKGR